jgi:hypothetical protein
MRRLNPDRDLGKGKSWKEIRILLISMLWQIRGDGRSRLCLWKGLMGKLMTPKV